jgi:hypothetical protein
LVRDGLLPSPRNLGGLERWHIDEVRTCLNQMYGLDEFNSQRDAERRVALEALDAWTENKPSTVRRGYKSEKQAVSLLPAGRTSIAAPRARRQRGIPV